MINQPINAFLTGANRKLGNTSECLLLSEIYTRGKESSSFIISTEYMEKVLGIGKTSQFSYVKKFEKLGLCTIKAVNGRKLVQPNMRNITKFIEEGSEELFEDLSRCEVAYTMTEEKPKKKPPKQMSILKQTFKSKIDYNYMEHSRIVVEYKNKRASGVKFGSKDGVFHNLTKLDEAVSSRDFSKITSTDFMTYFIIIFEEFYKVDYPRKDYPLNIKDIQAMKRFIEANSTDKKGIINKFVVCVERYMELGYGSSKYPRFTAIYLDKDWIVEGLVDNKPKTAKKTVADGVVRWDDNIDMSDAELHAESDEEF